MGVCKEGNSWRAFINNIQGNRISKNFSIKKFGENESLEMAKNQRLIWKQQYNYLGE